MGDQLDGAYLTWLYSQVGSVKLKTATRTYWSLITQLFRKEFVWLIPNDDNRYADGCDLRDQFLDESGIDNVDSAWLNQPCSMLEMLIALSRRLAFEAEGEPRTWFWHILENVDLAHINDRNYDERYREEIDATLERIIRRRYSPTGAGGLFPLKHPGKDQTQEEIWYQFCAYLEER